MISGEGIIKKMLSLERSNFMKSHNRHISVRCLRYSSLWILTLVIVVIASCSRSGGLEGGGNGGGGPHVVNDQDSIAPAITIATPTAAQVFTSGNTISMTGTITDETGLYRGSVKLVDDATGDELKIQHYEIHGFLSYNFTVAHTVTVSAPVNLSVTVSFEDHGRNMTTRSVKIKVNP